jgi:hypothetical protein
MGCYIRVRVKDRAPKEHPGYHKLSQRWDAISVIPDFAPWTLGRLDMLSGEHLYFHCTEMEVMEAELHLMHAEAGDDVLDENLRRRAVSIDFSGFRKEIRDRLRDVKKLSKQGKAEKDLSWQEAKDLFDATGGAIPITKAEILGAMSLKPPIVSPFTAPRGIFS